MKQLGTVPSTRGEIVELSYVEAEAIGMLYLALGENKWPGSAAGYPESLSVKVFGLIRELGEAIRKQNLTYVAIEQLVVRAARARGGNG